VFNAKIADKLQAARERLAAATASGVEAARLCATQVEADGAPALRAGGEGGAAAPTASEEEQARLEAAKQARLKTARDKKAVAAAGKAKREQTEAALKAAGEEAARKKVAEQAATRHKNARQRQAAALKEAKERNTGELKAVEEKAAALKASNKLKQAAALKEAKQKQAATLQAAYDTAQAAAALQIHPAMATTCVQPSTESPTPLSDRAGASSTEPLYSGNDSNSNSTLAAASDDDSNGDSNATEPLVSLALVPGGARPTAEVPAEVPGVAPTGNIWSHMFKVRDSWDAPRFWRACTILERLPDGAHELLFPNGQNMTASAAAVSINLLPYDMRIVNCLVVPAVVPATVPVVVPTVVPAVVPAAAPAAALQAVVVPPVMTPAVPARQDPRTHESTTEGAHSEGTSVQPLANGGPQYQVSVAGRLGTTDTRKRAPPLPAAAHPGIHINLQDISLEACSAKYDRRPQEFAFMTREDWDQLYLNVGMIGKQDEAQRWYLTTAVKDNAVVGTLLHSETGRGCSIAHTAVKPTYRSLGVGTTLVRSLQQYGKRITIMLQDCIKDAADFYCVMCRFTSVPTGTTDGPMMLFWNPEDGIEHNNKAAPSPTTMLEPGHKRARHHNTDEEQRQQPKQASLAADTNPHPWSQLQKHLLRQPVPTEPEEPNRASARCSDSYSSGRNGSSQADSSALGYEEPSAQQSAEPAPPAVAAWPRCISCGELLQSVPFRTCIWCNSYVHTGSSDDDKWQCYLQLADGKFSCERCVLGRSTGR
jgi:ribosomal protein S18 acetylase RimI-like enzyme